MQKVAGIASSPSQLRRTATSARIQTVSVTAAMVRSHTRPLDAALACHASTIAIRSQPFARNQNPQTAQPQFGGNGLKQTTAVRDALMNYNRLMERDGTCVPPVAAKPAAGAPAAKKQGAAQP